MRSIHSLSVVVELIYVTVADAHQTNKDRLKNIKPLSTRMTDTSLES